MGLLALWIVCIVVIGTGCGVEENDYVKLGFWNAGISVMDSLLKFKDVLKTFFHINYNKIEQSSLKFKKILTKFFGNTSKQIFGSNTKKLSSRVIISADKDQIVPLQFLELVSSHGYRAESRMVISKDGYILTLHKLLTKNNITASKKEVVLLHHGLLGSSEDWILLGPDKSLPYLLKNAGYEVWLVNSRGNKYSNKHITKTINNDEYWDFSWHEIGQYDLPAIIDYIRGRHKRKVKLHFIGHSMGATALLVLLSSKPQYNQKIASAILLGPLAFMYEVKGPLRLLAKFYFKYSFESFNFLGVREFVPFESFGFSLVDHYCDGNETCYNSLLLLANGGHEISDEKLKKDILNHVPSGGSIKTIIHYIQLINSGKFQMYDYGVSDNYKKYNIKSPSSYELKNVTLPVVVFSSSDDWLSTALDVHTLVSKLPNFVMHHTVKRHDFSHTDFVWAEDADVLIYYVVLDLLNSIAKESSFK